MKCKEEKDSKDKPLKKLHVLHNRNVSKKCLSDLRLSLRNKPTEMLKSYRKSLQNQTQSFILFLPTTTATAPSASPRISIRGVMSSFPAETDNS